MRLTQNTIQISLRSNKLGGYTLDLKMRNITTIMNISDFIKCTDIDSFIISFNYLKSLEDILLEFKNLNSFDISVNHLKEIKNLEAFRKLEHLNLSTNRITKIENLDKLKSLTYLDLSMNYIEKMENLNLPFLKTLILSGNQIKYIENIQNLACLEHLDVSKNKIESLGCLGLPPPYKNLKKLLCSNNLLSMNYLDDLIFSTQNLPDIEELDFTGNELTANKQYKYRFLYFKSLLRLDGIEIKGILKNHLETMKKTNEYDNLLERSKSEALEKLKADHLMKQQLISFNYEKEREVDMLYERYENNMRDDLDEFVDFMAEYQKKKNNGENFELSENVLSRWKNKIILAEKERERIKEKNDEKYDQIQKLYLDSKLTLLQPEKANFYKPNMERPHYWVDDKIASAYSMNITSNSVPDKNVENEIDKLKNGNKQNKKEIYLNKSTDSKATARPEDKTQTKILDSKPKKVVEEKREDSLSVQKTILKEKSLNKDKQNSVPMKDNKLKTLMETEEEKNSVIESIYNKTSKKNESPPEKSPIKENDSEDNQEWEKVILGNEVEGRKINSPLPSASSIKSKKKMILKIDTKQSIVMNNKKEDKKKDKNDFIKDDKLKEKLDKLTKTILDKDSSIDSHSVSRNTLLGKGNDVDWKAKRKEFLEKLKQKKTEEELIKKQTLEEKNEKFEKKQQQSKKCTIF